MTDKSSASPATLDGLKELAADLKSGKVVLALGNDYPSYKINEALQQRAADFFITTLSEAPQNDRCFDAAFKALQRLNSVRSMWNGPIHEAAAMLLEATGPQPDAPASVPSETPRSTIAAPAVAFIEHHKGGDNLTWDPIHHPNAPATPLYRSPVSATPKPFVHGALNCNHAWTGEGAAPASWWCCGVKVYRSYEDYCDD